MFKDEKQFGEPHVPQEPWRKLALDAADHIDKYGHAKGALYVPQTGAVCLRGAVIAAFSGEIPSFRNNDEYYNVSVATLYTRMMEKGAIQPIGFVGDHVVDAVESLVKWNNAPDRTKEDVVDLLRETAKAPEHAV